MLLEGDAKKEKFRQLDKVLAVYGRDPEQLIRVLQRAQDIFGYLPEEVQAYISHKMDIPVSAVNGVVTFYALFSTEPRGEVNVNVCLGTACYVQGAQKIYEGFREQLGIRDGNNTEDMQFTVRSSRCIGACGLAPVITVNEDVHGKVTAKDVAKLIRKHRKKEAAGEENEAGERNGSGEYQGPPPTGP
ncbi:complex I 24 kDa subunit family protein [Desulforamulus ruminis]|uniref:NADH dehydrogenase (Ubiquinone) 24 kDa subunit n=1 Tax=Desulforamulus ruminis (strain ATCC 23193 / DSM 2154 / NCIMB 8452 / DL) TaxID=696281 RepID=F6DS38_DESRL|nr:NAD(P)H-dependent oxidoreductase subunit E [Desulforamulus ruminis]AEG58800.1 NADH dehydrogenase (ubiquinone) 24 kDa subunit [Desulforamulus ruminis DSM 2154]